VRWPWLLLAVVVALAAAAVGWTELEYRRVRRQFERVFRAQVKAVSRLIWQGVDLAAGALDELYLQHERQLQVLASLLSAREPGAVTGPQLQAAGISAWLVAPPEGRFRGWWGRLAGNPSRQGVVVELMSRAPGSTIVEDEPLRGLGMYCVRFDFADRRVILCRRLEELVTLRRQVGLGRLLGGGQQSGLRYAVLQDAGGLLAGSPGDRRISSWSDDPQLARALETPVYRMTSPGIYEGLLPLPLPDGSRAVLRVGVDASPMQVALVQIKVRHRLLYLVAGLLVGLVLAGSLVIERRERRRLQMLEQLAERDREARHWQTVSGLAQGVAHEVRNPLNSIQMAAQRLQREFTVDADELDEYRQLLGVVRDQVQRLDRVVGEFMELGRPLNVQRERLLLGPALAAGLATLRLRAEQEGKRLLIDSRWDSREVLLDRLRFGQILTNLVGNALDALEKGGTVRVDLELSASLLTIEVADDGPGLDAAALERAKKPFFTTKARGTGLGLALVQRLCQAHGGSFELRSRPGSGTVARARIRVGREEEGA